MERESWSQQVRTGDLNGELSTRVNRGVVDTILAADEELSQCISALFAEDLELHENDTLAAYCKPPSLTIDCSEEMDDKAFSLETVRYSSSVIHFSDFITKDNCRSGSAPSLSCSSNEDTDYCANKTTKGNSRSSLCRKHQSAEQKAVRQKKDADRHRQYLQLETDEQKLLRRAKDAARHRQKYFEKKRNDELDILLDME
jgi:hypothetical protein